MLNAVVNLPRAKCAPEPRLTPKLLVLLLCAAAACGQGTYVNFESYQTNPVRLSPDGTRLFAVNTADARLSVFDVSKPANPTLVTEIPVGIEPVSVNARTSDEAWVVNQLSDTVSVVSGNCNRYDLRQR